MSDYLDDTRRLVSVFRSPRRDGMYLYVDRREGTARVPPALLDLFGAPAHAMDLLLTPQRQLARADAVDVLAGIRDRGYFLQMPPQPDAEMNAIILANEKLAAGRHPH
jgi:uncharacterized protein YcgL (UPF0745 family)